MNDAKKELADKLKSANNVLVTVSRDPTVDQLAALIGLTLLLNKNGKHAVAVFSGQIPSTLEFLQPEATIEKNTDSLRDFIIALDKSKADKLRYKVEDDVVRIFITPYRTSISEKDFDFSQGDFNVDVVIALGVKRQEDLDESITAHGRILHDATVASVDTAAEGELGTINWHNAGASSLSELVTELAQTIDAKLLDEQISNALLTGIVSATDRFSNNKTTSQTMSLCALLIGAGANQQLVADKLKEPIDQPPPPPADQTDQNQPPPGPGNEADKPADEPVKDDGSIEIDHAKASEDKSDQPPAGPPDMDLPEPVNSDEEPASPPANNNLSAGAKLITEPPSLGGTLTANSSQASLEPTTDPLSLPDREMPILNRDTSPPPIVSPGPISPLPAPPPVIPVIPPVPPAPLSTPVPPATQTDNQDTLAMLEAKVDSPHLTTQPGSQDTLATIEAKIDSPHLKNTSVDSARDSVTSAFNSDNDANDNALPKPIEALHAQPLGEELHGDSAPAPTSTSTQVIITPDGALMPADASPPADATPPASPATDSNAPPPVPPPIPFQFGKPASPAV